MAEVDLKAKITVAPVITSISATEDKKVQLKWKKSPLAEKYDVMRALTPDGDFVHVDWATGTEFTDTTAERDTTYWYKVVAWKRMEGKKTSKKASTLKLVAVSDIPPAEGLTVKADKGNIFLSWKTAPGCKYHIYRRSELFSRPVPVGESKNGSFTDENAVSGQIYHYCLQTVKTGGDKELYGNFSKEAATAFIDTTEILSAKKIWGRVSLDVKVVAGCDGYIFERSDRKDGGFTEVGRTEDITAVTFEEKSPSRLKSYYYRVRAYKKSGETELYGAYSEIKAVR